MTTASSALILAMTLFLVSTASQGDVQTLDNSVNIDFEQSEESKNLSQLIRSNTRHYWNWVRTEIHRLPKKQYEALKPWLEYEGFVMGDPHLGNFSVKNTLQTNGDWRMQYRAVDFDDVGFGPLVIDLARFIVATEAIDSHVEKADIVEAYASGLRAPYQFINVTEPKEVAEALSMSQSRYYKHLSTAVAKNIKGDRFKFEKGKLEEFDGPLVQEILAYFQKDKVFSVAKKIIDRGGSKEALRLWVLIEASGGHKIIELKEQLASGVSVFQEQPSDAVIEQAILNYYLYNIDPSENNLIALKGRKFLVREKTPSLINIPYNIDTQKKVALLQEYAHLAAYALGQLHGRQPSGQQLLKKIQHNGSHQMKESLEPFIREYLDFANKELSQSK